nr:MFS transporter [Novosphingobium sp. SG751A]
MAFSWIVSYIDRIAMAIAIPYIATDFHLSPVEMGAVMSTFFIGMAVAQIPGGLLADRFGSRKVATFAITWWSALTFATGLAVSLPQMLMIRFAFGIGEGLLPGCSFKTIAAWFPRHERAGANAIKMAAMPLGSALGLLIVGTAISEWGWRAVYHLLFVPGIISAIIFWRVVRDKPSDSNRVDPAEILEIEGDDASEQDVKDYKNIFHLITRYNIWKYVLIYFAFELAEWGFSTWLPTYLLKSRGFSAAELGAVASLPRFAGIAGMLFGGWIASRYFQQSKRLLIVATQLSAVLAIFLTATAESGMVLLVAQTMAGFCLNAFFSSFWAEPMTSIPKSVIGVAGSFITTAGQVAAVISPVIFGFLVGIGDGSFMLAFSFLLVALLVSCALVFTLPGKKARKAA